MLILTVEYHDFSYNILLISDSQGNKLYFGATDADFIGVGASIFLTITLLMFTVSNLIGHIPPTLLEVNLLDLTV